MNSSKSKREKLQRVAVMLSWAFIGAFIAIPSLWAADLLSPSQLILLAFLAICIAAGVGVVGWIYVRETKREPDDTS